MFDNECRNGCGHDQIVESPIHFFSLCEHHVLRVTEKRFTSQEEMGYQIADILHEIVKPKGVAILMMAEHFCTQMRGVHEVGAVTTTVQWKGLYEQEEELRQAFFNVVGSK